MRIALSDPQNVKVQDRSISRLEQQVVFDATLWQRVHTCLKRPLPPPPGSPACCSERWQVVRRFISASEINGKVQWEQTGDMLLGLMRVAFHFQAAKSALHCLQLKLADPK